MIKNRYQALNKKLIPFKHGCFIPFVILGDPSVETSLKIINSLIQNGADGLELGIPFSDPLADGPIIQKANLRAFHSKITLEKCFAMLHILRKENPNLPIGILIYANLIFRFGIKKFYLTCSTLDIDSVLIADLPIEESYIFRKEALNNNICSIFVCPPNSHDNFLIKLSKYSTGYIYLLSRPGVTGITNTFNLSLSQKLINKLKKLTTIPIIQGFGIYNSNQIKNIILSGISGVICGSIIVQTIEDYLDNEKSMLENIKRLSLTLKKATLT